MVAAALVAAAASTAHAAKLSPLTTRTLYALKSSADAMPNLLVSDAFTGTTGTTVNARASDTGQPWSVAYGALQIDTNRVRCSTCSSGNYAAALVDADLAQVTATVKVRSATNSGAAGLVLNANQLGTQAFAAWYDAGTVQLLRYVNGTATFVAGGTVTTPANNTDVPLAVTFSAGKYTVSFNNAQVLTYTLSAADQTAFGANTYFGVVIYDDPNVVRLDDFQVTR